MAKEATGEIRNRVIKQDYVDWKALEWIQGNLKEMREDKFEKLINSIVDNDIVKAFHVWENDGKIYCLDGNHLKKALEEIERRKLKKVPAQFKADFIECKDMKEAKNLVLVYSYVYTKITEEGLYEFLHTEDFNLDTIELEWNVPGLDFQEFKLGYLDNEFTYEEIPDVDIQGEVENKGEYLILQFSDFDEFERVKNQLGLKGKIRVIPFEKVKEKWGII